MDRPPTADDASTAIEEPRIALAGDAGVGLDALVAFIAPRPQLVAPRPQSAEYHIFSTNLSAALPIRTQEVLYLCQVERLPRCRRRLRAQTMLSLSKKTDYALIALLHLGLRPGECVSARAIADRYSLPGPLLMNLLKELASEGLVVSERGSRGGYRLAVEPAEITVGRVASVTSGPVALVKCLEPTADDSDEPTNCAAECNCPIKVPLRSLHNKLMGLLESVTLQDLIDDAPPMEPAMAERSASLSSGAKVPLTLTVGKLST